MGGFTSLNTAVSGLRAAQTGLAVTGHNMSNSQIPGYARQRVIQKDFVYQTIGQSPYGALKRGLGNDLNAVEQIRNEFLDITYRKYNSKLNFYTVKAIVGAEIESLLGEMQGSYNFQSVINDMWDSLQELSKNPAGIETRDKFLATCHSFITKANEVYNGLFQYQHRLNEQVRDMVKEINDLVAEINVLNKKIAGTEVTGNGDGTVPEDRFQNANDYRDARNLCLDRLSALIPIDYYEDAKGVINITVEGNQLLVQGNQNVLGLRYSASGYSFVEPVFTKSKTILTANTPPSEFTPLFNYNKPFSAYHNNDDGALKALMYTRGAAPAYWMGEDGIWLPLRWDHDFAADRPAAADYDLGSADPKYVTDMIIWQNNQDRVAQLYPPGNNAAENKRLYEAAMYNYNYAVWNVNNAMIPKSMVKIDQIVHSIVTMINDALAPKIIGPEGNWIMDPNAPFDMYGEQSYVEVFIRDNNDYRDRFDELGVYKPEVPGDYYSQYSVGNLRLNPLLLDTEGGYNFLAFSLSGDREDNRLLLDLLDIWADAGHPQYSIEVGGIRYGIQDAYQKFVVHLGIEVEEAVNYVGAQTIQVAEAERKRDSIMGVSMDEELSFMMKYQYAYQAAARIINVIDSMIDTVVNRMGGAGR